MPNTAILEALERILTELRGRGDVKAPLEESVRVKSGDLVISMQDLMDALKDNTRRLEELKGDHGAIRKDLKREILHMRLDLEELGREFRAHDHTAPKPEERDNLRYNPTPSAVEGDRPSRPVQPVPPAVLDPPVQPALPSVDDKPDDGPKS